jgi:hypothetical protein
MVTVIKNTEWVSGSGLSTTGDDEPVSTTTLQTTRPYAKTLLLGLSPALCGLFIICRLQPIDSVELRKSSVGADVQYECGGTLFPSTLEPQHESVDITASSNTLN